jgi:hypothetical protein
MLGSGKIRTSLTAALDKNEFHKRNGKCNVPWRYSNVLLKWPVLSVRVQVPFIICLCNSFDCLHTERYNCVDNGGSQFIDCSNILVHASSAGKHFVISRHGSFLGGPGIWSLLQFFVHDIFDIRLDELACVLAIRLSSKIIPTCYRSGLFPSLPLLALNDILGSYIRLFIVQK